MICKKIVSIIFLSLLLNINISYADHITKEGVFKDDPVFHNEKKYILSCRYGENEKYHVILNIDGDNATIYHVNKNEVYYFDDVELSEPNKVYKGGNEWNILWIGGETAIELKILKINYGYATKAEVPNNSDLYGPCVEINEIENEVLKKRYN